MNSNLLSIAVEAKTGNRHNGGAHLKYSSSRSNGNILDKLEFRNIRPPLALKGNQIEA
jgi:hypothetical protein